MILSYIKGVSSMVNSVASAYNQKDYVVDQSTGRIKNKNSIPIGTGTLFKIALMQITRLFLLLVSRAFQGCHLSEQQNELTCVNINNAVDPLLYSTAVTSLWLSYRVRSNSR